MTTNVRKLSIEEMNRLTVDEFKAIKKIPVIVILENIRSLNNIGSVFRTADAFALEAIYLVGITAKPPHREIQKTALGATESVDWAFFEEMNEAIEAIKQKNYHLFTLEQAEGSVSLNDISTVISKPGAALVLGNEITGVDQSTIDACDACIEIEQLGTKHSLNVSVSGAIAMWELFKAFK